MKVITNEANLVEYDKTLFSDLKTSTFILTRFNLHLYSKNKVNDDVQTEEWLKNRFELFESYCLPSVTNQNEEDFIWFCCFDENTPLDYRLKILNYKSKCRQFFPLFFNAYETLNHVSLLLNIIKDLKDSSNLLTTIRLDNDDALRYNFIQQVNSIRERQIDDNIIYSFKLGLQYFEEYGIAVKIKYPDNHFLALVSIDYNEELADKTILSFRHDLIKDFPYPFVLLKDFPPMWIEVIHSSNVANDVKKNLCNGIIINTVSLQKEYNINVNGEDKNAAQILYGFTFKLLPHYLAWYIRKILNKIKL